MAREMSERSFDELARGLAEGSISRRRALGLFAGTAVAALFPSTRALADDHDGYTICHVPKTPPNCDCTRARTRRGLSRRERNRHLRNHPCDSRGNCRNNPFCGTTTTTTTTSTTTSTTSTSTTSTSTTLPPTDPNRVDCVCRDGEVFSRCMPICSDGGMCTTLCTNNGGLLGIGCEPNACA